MPQPADGDGVGASLKGTAEHGHRVGVVQPERVRAKLFNVAENAQHRRKGTEEAEDRRRSAGVADVDGQPEFRRNGDIVVEIAVAADGNGGDNPVGTGEHFPAVTGCGDLCRILSGGNNAVHGFFGQREIGFVDVHKGNFGVAERFKRQKVTDEIPGEDQTAGTDENDFFSHDANPFCI